MIYHLLQGRYGKAQLWNDAVLDFSERLLCSERLDKCIFGKEDLISPAQMLVCDRKWPTKVIFKAGLPLWWITVKKFLKSLFNITETIKLLFLHKLRTDIISVQYIFASYCCGFRNIIIKQPCSTDDPVRHPDLTPSDVKINCLSASHSVSLPKIVFILTYKIVLQFGLLNTGNTGLLVGDAGLG